MVDGFSRARSFRKVRGSGAACPLCGGNMHRLYEARRSQKIRTPLFLCECGQIYRLTPVGAINMNARKERDG